MVARRVFMQVKPGHGTGLAEAIEKQVLPALRNQAGFQDEVTLVGNGGSETIEISLWDSRESAETYSREAYPDVAKLLAEHVEGKPKIRTYQVVNSTFHKIAAALPA
jgi:heme-degrading monooxygenase HmoA